MARLARGEMIDPSEMQICHTISRCVRRAFLCGDDPVSGESYEHRRQWIRDRLEFLASVFGIDCLCQGSNRGSDATEQYKAEVATRLQTQSGGAEKRLAESNRGG